MNTYFLRCKQADMQTLIALGITLGALVQHPGEDGQPDTITATQGGCWDVIGPIYRCTGELDDEDIPLTAPVLDGAGMPWWHANLTTASDLAVQIDPADWPRWFLVDDAAQITHPRTPQRLPAGWQPPAPPAQPSVPQSVTMRQARLALLSIGKLSAVTAAINALASPHKEAAQIEWEYSATVERNRPFVQMLAPALGLSDAQLDALFTNAAKL
jgi:hypothetical protein